MSLGRALTFSISERSQYSFTKGVLVPSSFLAIRKDRPVMPLDRGILQYKNQV